MSSAGVDRLVITPDGWSRSLGVVFVAGFGALVFMVPGGLVFASALDGGGDLLANSLCCLVFQGVGGYLLWMAWKGFDTSHSFIFDRATGEITRVEGGLLRRTRRLGQLADHDRVVATRRRSVYEAEAWDNLSQRRDRQSRVPVEHCAWFVSLDGPSGRLFLGDYTSAAAAKQIADWTGYPLVHVDAG